MSSRKSGAIRPRKTRPPTRLVVMNPSKGLNNLVSPLLIDDKEFSDSLNIEYDEGGVARKRYGWTAITGASGGGGHMGKLELSISQKILVMVNAFGTVRYVDKSSPNTSAWTTAGGSSSISLATRCLFTQAGNKLFIWGSTSTGGIDAGYFDGSNVVKPGTMPNAAASIYYQNKHIAFGTSTNPNRLYIANITDPSDFTVATGGTPPQPDNATDVPGATVFTGTPGLSEANIIDIRKDDGDRITAAGIFQDQIIVFKERSIYSLAFDDTGLPSVTPITYATGCVSHATVVPVENDLYFLSREGIRVLGNEAQYFDAIRTSVLSVRIQPTMDAIDKSTYYLANAIYHDNKYILSLGNASNNGSLTGYNANATSVVYDRRFQAFSIWNNFSPAAMVSLIDTSGVEHFFFMKARATMGVGSGDLMERSPGTYSDNGTAINAYFILKAQDFGNPDITKFWLDVGLVFRRLSGTIDLTVYGDANQPLGSSASAIGTTARRGMGLAAFGRTVLGRDGRSDIETNSITADQPERVGINSNQRTLKVKIGNNRLNESFVFLGIIYAVYPASHYLFDSAHKIYI